MESQNGLLGGLHHLAELLGTQDAPDLADAQRAAYLVEEGLPQRRVAPDVAERGVLGAVAGELDQAARSSGGTLAGLPLRSCRRARRALAGARTCAPLAHGVFTADRSGERPRRVLGGTEGTLFVDAYSGYNAVAEVSSRQRAACHAHLRRYFHEALPTAPVAQEAIDLILELYRVEHEAKEHATVYPSANALDFGTLIKNLDLDARRVSCR